jgi:hypothetical protein
MEIACTKQTNRARFFKYFLTNIKIWVSFGKFVFYMKEKVEILLVQYRLCSCLMKLKYLLFRPSRPALGPTKLPVNGYRVFPGCKVRPRHAADHSSSF